MEENDRKSLSYTKEGVGTRGQNDLLSINDKHKVEEVRVKWEKGYFKDRLEEDMG